MRTTLELNDALLRKARLWAARHNRTRRDVTEAALRRYLEEEQAGRAHAFRLKRASFRGEGLQAGLQEGDGAAIRARASERRSG